MIRRDRTTLAGLLLASFSVFALLTAQPGLDYWGDSASIDSLVQGDWHGFFTEQPLMGSLSLLLRAPFVAPVFHSSLTTVYFAGVIPCVIPLLVLAYVLFRVAGDRPRGERWAIVGVTLFSPLVIRAIHWGHPEDLLASALCLLAFLAATRDRPAAAGILLGLAFASKQWALVAGLPILLALPGRQRTFLFTAIGTGLLFVLPMLIGDPHRFFVVQRAAGSGDPSVALGLRDAGFPLGRTLPQSVWMPLSGDRVIGGDDFRFAPEWVAHVSHPLILLVCFPLAFALWRRGPVAPIDALRLMALLFLLRAALDTNDLDYYSAPVTGALAVLAAIGGRAEFRAMVFGTLGLAIAFPTPAMSLAEQSEQPWVKWLLFMAAVVPLGGWLARDLYFRERRLSVPDLKARLANDQALVEVEG